MLRRLYRPDLDRDGVLRRGHPERLVVYRMIAEARNKIGEQLFVTVTALRMILNREGERIIAEPDLLDDIIGGAPGLDLETVAEFVEGLMMRAVYLVEAMSRRAIGS